jgi:hypothetical protein
MSIPLVPVTPGNIGGGGATTLPAGIANNVLVFSGGNWGPALVGAAQLASGQILAPSKLTQEGGTSGQVLAWDGSKYAPTTLSVPLSGIQQGGATANQVPAWSGSAWVPTTIPSFPSGTTNQVMINTAGTWSGALLTESNFAAGKLYSLTKLLQGGATTGQFLAWDGTNWAPTSSTATGAGLGANTFTSTQSVQPATDVAALAVKAGGTVADVLDILDIGGTTRASWSAYGGLSIGPLLSGQTPLKITTPVATTSEIINVIDSDGNSLIRLRPKSLGAQDGGVSTPIFVIGPAVEMAPNVSTAKWVGPQGMMVTIGLPSNPDFPAAGGTVFAQRLAARMYNNPGQIFLGRAQGTGTSAGQLGGVSNGQQVGKILADIWTNTWSDSTHMNAPGTAGKGSFQSWGAMIGFRPQETPYSWGGTAQTQSHYSSGSRIEFATARLGWNIDQQDNIIEHAMHIMPSGNINIYSGPVAIAMTVPGQPTAVVQAGGTLKASNIYAYHVRAVDANGAVGNISGPSSTYLDPADGVTARADRTILPATTVANKTIQVSWTAVPDAASYQVWKHDVTGATWYGHYDTTSTTITDDGSLVFSPATIGTFTVTIASPAVFTRNSHGLSAGAEVLFRTTGALPTGLTVDTPYYVIAAGLTANAFEVSATPGGVAVNTSGTQSGTHTAYRLTDPPTPGGIGNRQRVALYSNQIQFLSGSGQGIMGTEAIAGGLLTGTAVGDIVLQSTTTAKALHLGGTTKIVTATRANTLGFFATTPVAQQATTGTTTGFTAATGTAVLSGSTFTGNTGSTAYTIGDIVRALKNYGLMAS